jgi:alpha-2-macroglobulin
MTVPIAIPPAGPRPTFRHLRSALSCALLLPLLLLLAVPVELLLLAVPATAQVPPQLDRLQRADGTHVVPDHFLRRWDPLTILFATPRGPADGGPEDRPGRIVTLNPPKPGAWTWLGLNTLQFRPAEP